MKRKYAVMLLAIFTLWAFVLAFPVNEDVPAPVTGVDLTTGEWVDTAEEGLHGPMKNPPVSNPKNPANSGLANSSDYSIKNDDDLGPGTNTNNGAGAFHAELVTDEQQV